jgi:hypothetical protein
MPHATVFAHGAKRSRVTDQHGRFRWRDHQCRRILREARVTDHADRKKPSARNAVQPAHERIPFCLSAGVGVRISQNSQLSPVALTKSVEVSQLLLGHTTPNVTMKRYLKANKQALTDGLKMLEENLKSRD